MTESEITMTNHREETAIVKIRGPVQMVGNILAILGREADKTKMDIDYITVKRKSDESNN